jgi:hypothetical protein
MGKHKNIWRDVASVTADQHFRLALFFQLMSEGNSESDACKRAFGSREAWRKNTYVLYQAAMKLGILRLDPGGLSSVEVEFAHRLGLRGARVVPVDPSGERELQQFHRMAAGIVLEEMGCALRDLEQGTWPEGMQSGTPELHVALGGGASVDGVAGALGQALPDHGSWLDDAARRRIHLWSATVGHDAAKWSLAAQHQVPRVASVLGIDAEQCDPLWGPPSFGSRDELEVFKQRHAARAMEHRERINVVITSCGAGDTYRKRVSAGRSGPREAAGEVLFVDYDLNGEPLKSPDHLFTLFPGPELPEKVARRRARSIGIVYADEVSLAGKARALFSSLRNPNRRWFDFVVTTARVASEVLAMAGRPSTTGG